MRVWRQQHENFACNARTIQCTHSTTHARYNARRALGTIATSNSIQCIGARDDNANVHVRDTYVHDLKMARLTIHDRLPVITLFSRGYSVSSSHKRLAEENISRLTRYLQSSREIILEPPSHVIRNNLVHTDVGGHAECPCSLSSTSHKVRTSTRLYYKVVLRSTLVHWHVGYHTLRGKYKSRCRRVPLPSDACRAHFDLFNWLVASVIILHEQCYVINLQCAREHVANISILVQCACNCARVRS